jgi:hypothetical protein
MAWSWTKDYSASDDGTVLGGADIQNIQDDISSQACDLATAQTLTGNKTFSGTTIISGTTTLSGTTTVSGDVTFSGAVNLPATGVIIGTAAAGVIWYDDGTDMAALAAGTSGQFLKCNGAAAPSWSGVAAKTFFEPDGTCFLAYNVGAKELSQYSLTATLTSLAYTDITTAKATGACYELDGANDYVTIATDASQAGMSALTIEAWVYRNAAASGDDYIIATDNDGYIDLRMGETNVVANIVTSSGTESLSAAHGLSSSGEDQWVHIVVTWDKDSAGKIYVNGVDKSGGDDSGNGTVSDSANGINIGADKSEANTWNGKIEIRCLARKMGAAEVLTRYNAYA